MGIQLALKGVMSREEWYEMRSYIKYDFQKDNYFSELKDQEILTSRLQLLNTISPYVGVYYTKEWVQKNVLRMSEDEIEKLGNNMEIDSADQMDQAIAANKSQPEMTPDEPPEKKKQDTKKPAPFSESFDDEFMALTEEDKKLIENMSNMIESIDSKELVDTLNIDLSDDTINNTKGLKK
jgi:hypothetical protein